MIEDPDASIPQYAAAGADLISVHAEACTHLHRTCLLYTSDAADERSSVDLGGRRIIKKKNTDRQDTP